MKKLSLFSLLGLTGLLAFFATPIYAQDEEITLDDEQIVAEAEDVVAEAEDVVADVEATVDEVLVAEDAVEFDDAYVEEDLPELEIADEDLGEVRELFDGVESLTMDSNSTALLTSLLTAL